MELKSNRPYLIRGIYDWIVDNQLTPYVLVDASKGGENLSVPMQYVDHGRIVLNIGPNAVSQMLISDETISFTARFSGQAMQIVIPFQSVLAMYAKEIGQGMLFNERYASTINTMNKSSSPRHHASIDNRQSLRKKTKPHLTLVK